MNKNDNEKLLVVSPKDLSKETLAKIAEAFVLREGTDYGQIEFSLAEKVQQVLHQLNSGQAEIIYDLIDESFDLRINQ